MNLTFDDVLIDSTALSNKILSANLRVDLIAGVTRGGWIPSRILSGLIGVKKMTSIGLSYTDESRTTLGTYQLPDPMPSGLHILVVEDCLESGYSLSVAKSIFSKDNNVSTASLYITKKTTFYPDFFVKKYDSVPVFPWENR